MFLVVATAVIATPVQATTRQLVLPIPSGQTWYVCQGYSGEMTHGTAPALDLSLERDSAGRRGCLAGSKYSSAGSIVSSPGAGTAVRWPGCCGDDFVCVNLDAGGSVAIGHLAHRVRSGTRVTAGQRIGTVAWPSPSNGDYSHIHVQAHAQPDCTKGGAPVAFDVAHGFKWACTPDLPYSGTPNQYAGLALSRCEPSTPAQRAKPRPQSKKVSCISRSTDVVMRSMVLLGLVMGGLDLRAGVFYLTVMVPTIPVPSGKPCTRQ